MARLGIKAKLEFGTGSNKISGAGIKDLSCEITAEESQIKSRGFDFIRYLKGQKDVPIDFNAEADAPCVAFLWEKLWATGDDADFQATFTDAGGNSFTGTFICTKCGPTSPVSGEEEYAISIRLSANAPLEDQPTHTEATSA